MAKIVKTTAVVLPANSPLLEPLCHQETVWALKALAAGEAVKAQQSMAIQWIVNKLCGTYDMPYRPGSQSDTDFAMGKMFVGQQIVKFIKMEPDAITRLPKIAPSGPGEDDEIQNM